MSESKSFKSPYEKQIRTCPIATCSGYMLEVLSSTTSCRTVEVCRKVVVVVNSPSLDRVSSQFRVYERYLMDRSRRS